MLAAAAALLLAALSAAPLLAQAAPVDPRIVPTLSCVTLDASYTAAGLFVGSPAVAGQLVPVGIAADGNATWETTGEGSVAGDVDGEWGFEICDSSFLGVESTETVFYGHTTFTPVLANGSLSTNASDVKCLGATYAYVGDTPALQECSASDDSGQFLLTWQLEIVPSDDAAFNGTTILSFVGPAGSVASYDAGLLGPSTYVPGAELVLSPSNATDASFFTFSALA